MYPCPHRLNSESCPQCLRDVIKDLRTRLIDATNERDMAHSVPAPPIAPAQWSTEPPREPVRWFAQQMERKLAANDHKSHWSGIRTMHLFNMLIAETKELHSAFGIGEEPGDPEHSMRRIIDEAADVANFAMMIADKARAIIEPPADSKEER
jgi:NTP pyrophosphatase (non-canonical NTP hydrolase)